MNLNEFRRVLKQAFFVPLLALLALAGVLLWQVTDAQMAQRWLDHSDRVSVQVAELERLILDQETGLRGYELTGDPVMLAPFKAAAAPIDAQFTLIRRLVSDNPTQLSNLVRIHDRYLVWLGFANNILSTPNPASDSFQNHRGKDLMDAVREATRTMSQVEEKIRRDRMENAIILERRELIVIIAGALLVGIGLSIFSLTRLRLVSRAYQSSLDELQERSNELHESREWLHTTLRSIGDAVIVCDAASSVQFMNPIAEELTGWSLSEAATRPLNQVFHIVHEHTRKEAENPVEKVRRLNKVIGLANHTALIARNGTEYVIDDSAAPIRDKNSNLIGIVLVFRDVTDQKRTEAALIASEKLAVAGRLAASIAHEIHNPLDSVTNLHYLLGNETDPQKRAEYLNMAQQELKRTMQISRTLLNLYREPNAPVNIDLKELLEGVLLLLQRRLDTQGVTVQHNFDGSFVIEGFPAELRQVFTNLITNAADATGVAGTILIRMHAVPAEELHGAGVIVEILDSGPGIPDQAEGKLFQPFFTTKGDQGTGLGLWVSMGIVQKHGGTIRLKNSDDAELRGACVRVYLPARTLATSSSRATAHVG
ncbi:MAG TPA: CHASE3 domain-containing protein [Pseudacidobacterium sp.]|nr:CHASE3 domain-containing protein [Pseudacidobacterium sp.]